MIADVIDQAFARGVVLSVAPGPGGCDDYLLERIEGRGSDGPIQVRVRPDGRFSRALGREGLLSLGQVTTLCGLQPRTRTPREQPSRAHTR